MRDMPVRVGPYEIVIELASGGMATTYIAHKRGDAFFERLVVVKRIHPWLLEDPKSGNMLREEARLGAALQHPHVVHVEDVTVSEGEVCLVMPYVESLSLGALLKAVAQAGERLPPAITSRIMLDALSGLDAAHDARDLRGQPLEIVHRDVSPNNILVGTDGRSRVIDFGIARATSRLCKTQSGDIKGTIAYMSPEQLRRRELDRRADVFAAGAVLYEMLAGERLFRGRDEADILIGVLADEIPSVCAKSPDLSGDIDSVVSRALARERDERFSTARVFGEELERALVPASAAEVAAFVERFGISEFGRRRGAIRTFVDHHGTEAFSLEVRPDVHTSMPQRDSLHGKRNGWRVAAPVGMAILIACSMVVIWARSSSIASNVAVVNAPTLASHVEPGAQQHHVEALPSASSGLAPAPGSASLSQLSGDPPAQQSPATSARRIAPIREKVDKRRPSELQQNPYR